MIKFSGGFFNERKYFIMSNLELFMKGNKKQKTNGFFAATKSLVDPETGEALNWEIKPISTKEDEAIRDACTHEVPIPGKRNQFRIKIDANAYMVKQVAASVVFPNLLDAKLQDSYGVKTPEDLIREMIDDPTEFAEFAAYIREFNGFDTSINDDIEEAKN